MNLMLCEVGSLKDVQEKHLKWIGQRKIDGVRCVAVCHNGITMLKGRSGTDITKNFQEIARELSFNGMEGVFDGEIVCDTFEHTASRIHTQNKLKQVLLEKEYPATFWIFDLPYCEELYLNRLSFLSKIEDKIHYKILPASPDLIGLWEKAKSDKWEGLIIKNPVGKYENRRSRNQLKIKILHTKDIVVNSYEINNAGIRVEGEGIALQISGSQHEQVKKQIDETGSAKIEVEYLNETESGKLRMPTFSKFKDGN